jgi:hypothetical protein
MPLRSIAPSALAAPREAEPSPPDRTSERLASGGCAFHGSRAAWRRRYARGIEHLRAAHRTRRPPKRNQVRQIKHLSDLLPGGRAFHGSRAAWRRRYARGIEHLRAAHRIRRPPKRNQVRQIKHLSDLLPGGRAFHGRLRQERPERPRSWRSTRPQRQWSSARGARRARQRHRPGDALARTESHGAALSLRGLTASPRIRRAAG